MNTPKSLDDARRDVRLTKAEASRLYEIVDRTAANVEEALAVLGVGKREGRNE